MSHKFRKRIRQSLADGNLQTALDNNAQRRKDGRLAAFASLLDHQDRRAKAHAIKAEVIDHLDQYLAQFIEKATANGILVHRAADSAEAVKTVLEICDAMGAGLAVSRRRAVGVRGTLAPAHTCPGRTLAPDASAGECRGVQANGVPAQERPQGSPLRTPILVAKSKSMVTEEIHLNHALETQGIRVVETDLGEYIVQLRGEVPSHIITPAVHLRRQEIGQLFNEKLGIPYTEDIPTLTKAARRVLREIFLAADVGVSGVNFGVAETGTLCMVTNEGNGRMVTSLPPVHVALMGIERIVPTLDDLALFLSILPRSATGQKLSVYTSLIHSPKRPADPDGPLERHLILVDNGRSRLLASPLREALYCIRCGACLNACPVFREIGGHAYLGADGSIAPYPGPIGSVISPGMFGCENFGHLAQASSLCGACKEACPVDIDLPGMLLRVRSGLSPQFPKNGDQGISWNKKEGVGIPFAVKSGLKAFRLMAGNPGIFAVFQRLGGLFSQVYSPSRAFMRIPAWTGWGYSKNFPRLAVRPFRRRWGKIKQKVEEKPARSQESRKFTETMPQPAINTVVDQFRAELASLGGQSYLIQENELPTRLAEFLESKSVDRILVDAVGAGYIGPLPGGFILVREPDPSVRVGVTGALAGIAETGSLVLISNVELTLAASLLPEIHVAILKTSRLVPTVADALRRPEIQNSPAGVIITGPSRTADIEMTLTIGVHGPGELHVFLIDDSAGV